MVQAIRAVVHTCLRTVHLGYLSFFSRLRYKGDINSVKAHAVAESVHPVVLCDPVNSGANMDGMGTILVLVAMDKRICARHCCLPYYVPIFFVIILGAEDPTAVHHKNHGCCLAEAARTAV